MRGLDDHDAANQSEIALQAMLGLSQVLSTVNQSHIKDIQGAVALRVKPFFEKVSIKYRHMTIVVSYNTVKVIFKWIKIIALKILVRPTDNLSLIHI